MIKGGIAPYNELGGAMPPLIFNIPYFKVSSKKQLVKAITKQLFLNSNFQF
jgi:hypothetical protein